MLVLSDKQRQARLRAFGLRVRQLRLSRGLSQEALADLAGVHRTYVGSIERGERNISFLNIEALAEALGAAPGSLFERPVRLRNPER